MPRVGLDAQIAFRAGAYHSSAFRQSFDCATKPSGYSAKRKPSAQQCYSDTYAGNGSDAAD